MTPEGPYGIIHLAPQRPSILCLLEPKACFVGHMGTLGAFNLSRLQEELLLKAAMKAEASQ